MKKWNNKVKQLNEQIKKGKILVDKRENNEKNMRLLKQYFNDWNMRTALIKYIALSNDVVNQKKKFYGIIDLIEGIKMIWKRIGFNFIFPYLMNYLAFIEKNRKFINLILKLSDYEIIQLRKGFNQWKNNVNKMKLKGFKNSILKNHLNRIDSRLNRINLKKYFEKWNDSKKSRELFNNNILKKERIIDNNDILKGLKGFDLLKKYCLLKIYSSILQIIKKNGNGNYKNKKLLNVLRIKNKNLGKLLNKYIKQWNTNSIKSKYDKLINKLCSLLIEKIYLRWRLKTISVIFHHWFNSKSFDYKIILKKYGLLLDGLNKLVKQKIKPSKLIFIDNLKQTKNQSIIKKASSNIYFKYSNKDKRKIKHYFYKWRETTNLYDIQSLKAQLFKYLYQNREMKYRKLSLSKYINRWKLVSLYNQKDIIDITYIKKMREGFDKLYNIYNNRVFYFLKKLIKNTKKDYKPLYLKTFFSKIDKSKDKTRSYFDKWKKITLEKKYKGKIDSFKSIILKNSAFNIKNRTNRDLLFKYFYKWRNSDLKKEIKDDYYLKIIKGLNTMSPYTKKLISKEPFDKIKKNKNKSKLLKSIIKSKENNEKKSTENLKRKAFNKWIRNKYEFNNENIVLKGTILFLIKKKLIQKLLQKYFSIWKSKSFEKLNKKKLKGLNLILNKYGRKYFNEIMNYIIKKALNDNSQNKPFSLSKLNSELKNSLLHKYLMIWLKNSNSELSDYRKKKTRLRRLINNKQKDLLSLNYKKWVNKTLKNKLNEKDIEKAKKIISNRIKLNDKLLLYKYFNKWRNQMNYLKEIMLKSIFIKKIKNSQNLKEKGNEKYKLHISFLKWKNKLKSDINNININNNNNDNTYKNINNIRKGYNLLKKGLRKRYQLVFYKSLKESLSKLKRNKLLKNLVKNIKPKSDLRKKEKLFKKWLSEIQGSNEKKNKIKDLFLRYLLTNNTHNKLIQKGKNEIIELFNDYNNLKRNHSQNIINFLKSILKKKRILNRMRLSLLLNKILKSKEKNIKKSIKIYLINFLRNTKKISSNIYISKIQKFLKKKFNNPIKKQKNVNKGLELLKKFIKKNILNQIKKLGKKKLNNILLKSINKKNTLNKKILSEAISKWKSLLPILKQNNAVLKIQSNYRTYLSKKKMKNLIKLKAKLTQIYKNKNLDLRKLKRVILYKWLRHILFLKQNDDMIIIQRFIRGNIDNYNKKENQKKLKKLIKKYVFHQIYKLMKKLKKSSENTNEVLFKTLEDIYIRNPFNKLKSGLKSISRKKTLGRSILKVKKNREKYYLPIYLNKWKKNTYELTNKNAKLIQKYLIDKLKLKKEKKIKKRNELLIKIINKLINDKKVIVKIPFKIWQRKVKVEKLNNLTNIIQKALKKYKIKSEIIKKEIKQNLKKMFKQYLMKIISDYMIESNKSISLLKESINLMNSQIEKRYSINNIMNNNLGKLRLISLKKILDKIKVNKNESSIKSYLKKWRHQCSFTNKYADILHKAFNKYYRKRKKAKENKIKELLLKIYNKKSEENLKKLKAYLIKWINKVRVKKANEKSNIIQKYLKPKVRKKLNKKLKDFYINKAKKLVKKRILKFVKLYKLNKCIQKRILKYFIDKLKKKAKFIDLKNILLKKFIKINNDLKRIILKNYLNKWKNKKELINLLTNKYASIIQKKCQKYKSKAKDKKNKKIKDKLNKILLRKINYIKNLKRLFLFRWKNYLNLKKFNKSTKILQNFMKKIRNKLNNKNNILKQNKIQKGIDKLNSYKNKFKCKKAFNKIKEKRKNKINSDLFNFLINKRKNLLKTAFDKIKEQRKNNLIKNLLKKKEAKKKRIYKNYLDLWKNNTNKLIRKFAASTIQKNYKLYKKKNKNQKLQNKLINLFNRLNNTSLNLKNFYLLKWNKITKAIKIKKASKRIYNYILKKYKMSKARKNWKNLIKQFKNKKGLKEIKEIITYLKRIILFKKFKQLIQKHFKKKIMKKIKDYFKKTILKNIIRKHFSDKKNLLKKEFAKLKNKIKYLKERDSKFINCLNKIEIRKKIVYLNNIFLIKKLLHDIKIIKAKYAFLKLKRNLKLQKKFDQLGITLKKANKSVLNQNEQKFIKKLIRIINYKKINKLFNYFDKIIQKKLKLQFERKFFNVLKKYMKKKIVDYEYKDKKLLSNKPKIIKLKFKSKSKDREKRRNNDKLSKIKKVIPYFIKYLEKKKLLKRKETFNFLKFYSMNNFYLKYSKNKLQKEKKHFIESIKNKSNNEKKKKENSQKKLNNLFNKGYLKLISQILIKSNRIYNLLYLLKLVKFHSNISKKRLLRELLRKWRFLNFIKNIATRKLELMYRNMHASYLQMANEFFGDENEKNPSILKEFERFSSTLGMFAEDNTMNEKLGEKYYSNLNKKYNFNQNIFDDKLISSSQNSSLSRFEKIEDNTIQNDDYRIEDFSLDRNNSNYKSKLRKNKK